MRSARRNRDDIGHAYEEPVGISGSAAESADHRTKPNRSGIRCIGGIGSCNAEVPRQSIEIRAAIGEVVDAIASEDSGIARCAYIDIKIVIVVGIGQWRCQGAIGIGEPGIPKIDLAGDCDGQGCPVGEETQINFIDIRRAGRQRIGLAQSATQGTQEQGQRRPGCPPTASRHWFRGERPEPRCEPSITTHKHQH